MNTIIYRKGSIHDVREIKAVSLKAYGQFRDCLTPDDAKAWEENLGRDDTYINLLSIATCFVAVYNDTIVGTAFLIPRGNPYKWFAAEWSYIRLVGVLPEYSGKGIGRKLTELCIELAKEKGEKTIALHTSEFQDAARHIYESMGFEKIEQFELFERTYWLYTLALTPDFLPAYSFRKAGIEDVEILTEYRICFALELSGEQTAENIELLRYQMTNYFSKAATDNSCISIIATRKNEVVGIGSVHLREMPGNFKNPSGKWGYIMNMYTVPEHRRKGICRTILNRLMEEGIQRGTRAFELHATKDGEPAYKKNGFDLHHEPTLRKIIAP